MSFVRPTEKKLGKLPRIYDHRVPSLHKVMRLAGHEPQTKPPIKTNWRAAVKDWPMLYNDQAGDCVVAAALHAYQGWTANNGNEVVPDQDSAIKTYEDITLLDNGVAYNPTNGEGDTGLIPDKAVQYWMSRGVTVKKGMAPVMLDGQAEIEPADISMIMTAINEFGGVFTSFELPESASQEFDDKKPWSDTCGTVGGWGGHETWTIDYDETYFYTITWGAVQKIEHKFWIKYVDQTKALLQASWINEKTKDSPSHLNIACLSEQIRQLRGELGASALV